MQERGLTNDDCVNVGQLNKSWLCVLYVEDQKDLFAREFQPRSSLPNGQQQQRSIQDNTVLGHQNVQLA